MKAHNHRPLAPPRRASGSDKNNTTSTTTNIGEMHRRLRRIFAFALFFVITSLLRMYRGEHSDFELLSKLMLDVSSSPSSSSAAAAISISSKNKKYAAAENADLIIFYNLYIPHDKEGIVNAINVIQDQMGQISSVLYRIEKDGGGNNKNKNDQKATTGGATESNKRGVILYNLIGNQYAFPANNMTNLCQSLHPRLECHLIQYYEEAGEAVTLQDVHDFCNSNLIHDGDTANTTTTTRVTYLHSKGSYHSQKENHIWRKQMTEATLHPQCLNPPDDSCDVCSAQFYIKYAIMFPGNMWTAKCSYIQKLISPNDGEYERRKYESIKHFMMLRLWGVLQATLDVDNVEHYGLDRYQWEHWIAHPSINPCEMHTTDVGPLILLGKDIQKRPFGPEYYDWGMGPRRITHNLGGLRVPRLRLEANPELQFREYYFLPGNLLKWFHLYGAEGVPAPDSWVWKHFPAGDRWKEMVGQHRERAIDVMVNNTQVMYHSAFAAESTTRAISFDNAETLGQSNPPVVVFYQISFPSDNMKSAMSAIEAQFDVISRGQYDNITQLFDSSRKVSLFYTISGGDATKTEYVSKLCQDKSDTITCQQLGKYDDARIFGATLQRLHAFCESKPSLSVIYLSNILPWDTNDIEKVRAITSAVMSKMCIPSEDKCNVCGSEFYPLPFLQFTGNLFSATCSYVKNLLPPSTFEERMNDIAGDVLIAQVEEVYTTKLVRFNAQILGSYQHSVEHWIGSHPYLKPCDVAPMKTEKKSGSSLEEQMEHYSWSLAPRHGRDSALARHYNIDVTSEPKFRTKRVKALREYYYLAGNVIRWHRLYEKMPDASSWAWMWYPDGHSWSAAAGSSGADAVDAMIKHFQSTEEGSSESEAAAQ